MSDSFQTISVQGVDIPVLIEHKPESTGFFFSMNVQYGRFSEDVIETAHAIEHYLVMGTKKYPSRLDLKSAIESKGGAVNASTANEVTTYFVHIAKEHQELAIDVVTDMICSPTFDPEALENVQKTISVELGRRKRDDMYNMGMYALASVLSETSYGQRPDLDTRITSVNNLTLEQLKERYQQQYVLENMICCISGNINDTTIATIKKQLEEKYTNTNKKQTTIQEVSIQSSHNHIENDKGSEYIAITIPTPKNNSGEYHASIVLRDIIGAGTTSRLTQILREQHNLSYSPRAMTEHIGNNTFLLIVSDVQRTKTKEAIALVEELLQQLKTVGPTAEEVEFVKQKIMGRLAILENTYRITQQLVNRYTRAHKMITSKEFAKQVQNVTLEQVQAVAKKYLPEKIDNSSCGIVEITTKEA